MNEGVPESEPTSIQSKVEGLRPGYTIARIKGFTPTPCIAMREIQSKIKLNTQGDVVPQQGMTEAEIIMETAGLSSMFIPQVWKKIQDWTIAHPPGLAIPRRFPEDEKLIPLSKEELMDILKSENFSDTFRIFFEYTEWVFSQLAKRWEKEQEEKLQQTEPEDEQKRRGLVVYRRYKEVLGYGMSNVVRENGASETLPGRHILGGLTTGLQMIFQSFKILTELYQQSHNRQLPTKEELKKLVRSAKPLLLAIAQSDVQTLSLIQEEISKPEIKRSLYIAFRNPDFDPSKFLILQEGSGLFLEIRPEVLEKIEERLKTMEHDDFHTGCPALFAEGRSAINELYDWAAKLCEEFYIEAQPKFK